MTGQVILQRCRNDDATGEWINVVRADDEILISDEFLNDVSTDFDNPWASVTVEPRRLKLSAGDIQRYVNATLTVHARNGELTYRVGEFDGGWNAWRAEKAPMGEPA